MRSIGIAIVVLVFAIGLSAEKALGDTLGFIRDGENYSYFASTSISTFDSNVGINNSGQIVGRTLTGQSFVITNNVTTFSPLPSSYRFHGINDSGTIVGTYADESPGVSGLRGFTMTTDGNVNIFTHPDSVFVFPNVTNVYTQGLGINSFNQIVGTFLTVEGFGLRSHGFVKDGDTYTTLNYPDAVNTYAKGINDAGNIVGIYTDLSFNEHGFLYANGLFNSFDFPDAKETYAFDINNSGQIVGYYTDNRNAKHGFLYESGFMSIDAPFPGLHGPIEGTVASAINDRGVIVGQVEAQAVPEPATILLLSFGIVGIAALKKL